MTQFYFRDGRKLSDKQNETVQIGKRGDSGFITERGPCSRCGGAGHSSAWYPEGGICFRCCGRNSMAFEVHSPRVFSEDKLVKLIEAADKKAAKAAEAAQVKATVKHLEFVQWGRPHKTLLGDIAAATGNSFLENLAFKLTGHNQLTDRQLEAAAKTLAQAKEHAITGAASKHIGVVKDRVEFEAKVIGVYDSEGFYGHTDIVKFQDADGNYFTWFASGYTDLKRGDLMNVKGTVKKHDEYRDVKQTILTRCKFTIFEIMTADEAANLEEVA